MRVSKEANIHYYAKLALARMLDMYHEGDNCFHVIEYPIIEGLDYQAFDEFYRIFNIISGLWMNSYNI